MKIRPQQMSLFLGRAADNAARAPLRVWLDPSEPFGDNFAGGGGVRVGMDLALAELGITDRTAQDVAVNHWGGALSMYRANHPRCRTYCEDIAKVDPLEASGGKRYALAWFSPTCIFFSQAKGGALDETATKVRGLCWIANTWAASAARPRVLCLENVPPFVDFGPLHRKHGNGCSKEAAAANGTIDKKGRLKPKCLKGCCYMRPIKARKGSLFQAFIRRLSTYYRYVEWRIMKAHHYGAPTSRKRFVLVASDEPMSWPVPTHGPGLEPYKTAAECIDWSIPCPSIFEREILLKPKTCARIVAGMHRFVFGAARPFIVPTSYGDKGGADQRVHDIDEPSRTIAGNRSGLNLVAPYAIRYNGQRDGEARGQRLDEQITTLDTANRFAIATPYLVHRSNGERGATETTKAQQPRAYDAQKPISTLVGTLKHGIALPVLVKNYSERATGGFVGGQPIDKPAGAITQRDHHSIALMSGVKLRGTDEAHVDASPFPLDQPSPTASAKGTHLAMQAAYLVRYNGQSAPANANEPISTIDTKDRFGLVTVQLEREVCDKAMRVAAFLGYDAPIILEIDGVEWVLVDIGFRMLTARELFRCQGFPESFRIDVDDNGKPLTKTAQIKCVGNSVPPPLAKAIVMAALATIRYEPEVRRAA